MQNSYRVSIRIDSITRAGIDASTGYDLADGLEMKQGGKPFLCVRVQKIQGVRGDGIHYISDPITYLDIDITGEDVDNAIRNALVIARRFITLLAFQYNYGFQINLAGGVPVLLLPDLIPVGKRTYLDHRPGLTSLEDLMPLWEQFNNISDENAKSDLELALEWFHIGLAESDDRIKFLSYWTGLELLLGANTDTDTSKVLHQLPEKERGELVAGIEQVLSQYSPHINADLQRKICNSVENTNLEPLEDRWSETLTESGVLVKPEELKPLYKTRNRLTHSGGRGKKRKGEQQEPPLRAVPVVLVKEITKAYIEKILQAQFSQGSGIE